MTPSGQKWGGMSSQEIEPGHLSVSTWLPESSRCLGRGESVQVGRVWAWLCRGSRGLRADSGHLGEAGPGQRWVVRDGPWAGPHSAYLRAGWSSCSPQGRHPGSTPSLRAHPRRPHLHDGHGIPAALPAGPARCVLARGQFLWAPQTPAADISLLVCRGGGYVIAFLPANDTGRAGACQDAAL